MAERALWARNEFIKNPANSQVDDDTLVWCFNSEDQLWYSIAGNYSQYSPEDKRIKEANKNIEYENRMQTSEEMAEQYYQSILYQSKIREIVFKRDKNRCQICGKKGNSKFHIHHILKRRHGGGDFIDNLLTVCPGCHKDADIKNYNPNWE